MTRQERIIEEQRASFGELVREGVYSEEFKHSANADAFFRQVVAGSLGHLKRSGRLEVLDVGCGTGYWLASANNILRDNGFEDLDLYGFDLTPEMVDVAEKYLSSRGLDVTLQTGNALDVDAYRFDGHEDKFDLVIVYDVIQQLPPGRQKESMSYAWDAVRDGGVLIVFDRERNSLSGLTMSCKKFITRHLGIPLVPKFYCNARYPSLKRMATGVGAGARMEALSASDWPKDAVVLYK